jgi:L-fucose isomerase-like protein
MEEVYGVAPCNAMSYLSDNGIPAACETDVLGALSMRLLHAATDSAPTILDWNNNYGDDENACVVFHCGNLPQSTFRTMQVTEHPILSATLPPERTRGTCEGCLRPGETTFLRLSTRDWEGTVRGYIGTGTVTMEDPETFGAVGVLRVERLQELMQTVCREGFEHHVCMAYGSVAEPLFDALSTYLGVEMIRHR